MSTRLCDTQIISYSINGRRKLPSPDVAISSTTAQELLLVQGREFTRNNYYVPFPTEPPITPGVVEALLKERGKFRKDFGKNRTDRFILDFGIEHPTVIEYSHVALARVSGSALYTNDELLATFAANYTGVAVNQENESLIIDFTQNKGKKNRVNRGSKGYVNKGWRVHW